LGETGVKATGTVVIGTVKGDLHDIGKKLVAMMLEGAGFVVIDLGTDVAPDRFADGALQNRAQLVALSALLTTTMQNMREVIEALQDVAMREQVGVMVGGAPVTEAFAQGIGADGYAPDASRAVDLARRLASGKAAPPAVARQRPAVLSPAP
jgi:5-methyltetrahydrofolate--homocysteine methyltransferase